jgi:hypothetical protein
MIVRAELFAAQTLGGWVAASGAVMEIGDNASLAAARFGS